MERTSKFERGKNEEAIGRRKKLMIFIVVMLVILAILAVLIYLYIGQLKNHLLKITIDEERDKSFVENEDIIINEDVVYFSMKKLCATFGYGLRTDVSYFVNEKSEDSFFIEGPNETVNFFYFDEENPTYKTCPNDVLKGLKEKSTKYQKVIRNNLTQGRSNNSYTERTDSDDKAQTFTLNREIGKIDGEYYISLEDAKVIFNLYINYDKNKNAVTIYTLDYLVEIYSNEIPDSALLDPDMYFCNKKALLYGCIITRSEVDGEIKYGVTDLETRKSIIANTRANIEFVEGDKEFIVTTSIITSEDNAKVAIYSIEGDEIISPKFVEVTKIDDKRNWYLVKDIGADRVARYGIVDKNNRIVVDVKYKKIGINKNDFSLQSIDNPYILFDSVIPALRYSQSKTDDWVFLNFNNQEITTDSISSVGCTLYKNSTSGGALLFEEKGNKLIVVGRMYDVASNDGRETKSIEAYTLLNTDGELLQGNPVSAFYVNYNDRGVYFDPLTDEQQMESQKMAIALLNDGLLVDVNNSKRNHSNENQQNNEQPNNQQEEENTNQEEQQYVEDNEEPGDNTSGTESSAEIPNGPGLEDSNIQVTIEEQ